MLSPFHDRKVNQNTNFQNLLKVWFRIILSSNPYFMNMDRWNIEALILNLKFTWAISRNSSNSKTNFLVSYTYGGITGIGEVAPNVRYGENTQLVFAQWNNAKHLKLSDNPGKDEITGLLESITLCNALRCGLECALLHWVSQKKQIPVHKLLRIPKPSAVDTLFSIPIMEPKRVAPFIKSMNLERFKMLKVKISSEQSIDFLNEVLMNSHVPLLLDANESFDSSIEFENFLKGIPLDRISLIEQPFKSELLNEYKRLKSFIETPVIADESCLRDSDILDLTSYFTGINIKLMKTGGPIRAAEHLQLAKKHGIKTMIGCMIESPIGIWWAYTLNSLAEIFDLDSFLMLKNINEHPMKETNGTLFSPHNGTSSL